MKTSSLLTSCRGCARGLLLADDGETYCPFCTRFTIAAVEPFVACVGQEVVESAADLDELLGILAEITDEKPTEDIVITQGHRVVLVLFTDGTVLDRPPPPPPLPPPPPPPLPPPPPPPFPSPRSMKAC